MNSIGYRDYGHFAGAHDDPGEPMCRACDENVRHDDSDFCESCIEEREGHCSACSEREDRCACEVRP